MTLAAFTRTRAGLFKVYDHGDDWQIVGPSFERWTSTWAQDRRSSLLRACSLIPDANPNEITITEATK